MWQEVIALSLVAMAVASCTQPPERTAANRLSDSVTPATAPGPDAAPTLIQTFFDPITAQTLMAARADYDAAEAAALAESERIIGSYRNVMMATREQISKQLAGPGAGVQRTEGWLYEQKRRSEYAASITQPKIVAAREKLRRTTLNALSAFFVNELKARRISKDDYTRYTVEIRRGYLPAFRGRKWSGPAVYEWRGGDVSSEYRKVLQEVRKLWQAQGKAKSAVSWGEATPEFYRKLVSDASR